MGPIIVISACGLPCLALYNRLAAVVTRLRTFHREQVSEHEEFARLRYARTEPDRVTAVRHQELLGMLEVQVRRITRRAHWIRRVLVCADDCGLNVVFARALARRARAVSPGRGHVRFGMALLMLAVVFALVELRQALDPIELEARFIADLPYRFGDTDADV